MHPTATGANAAWRPSNSSPRWTRAWPNGCWSTPPCCANDLARGGRLSGPDGGPPPLLPLVVYNGARRWTTSLALGTETSSLPKGLADLQPRFGYTLIDVRRFAPDALAEGLRQAPPGVNFALALFALENASALDLPDAMGALAGLLGVERELELAESFGLWIEGVLQPRLGVQLPSLNEHDGGAVNVGRNFGRMGRGEVSAWPS